MGTFRHVRTIQAAPAAVFDAMQDPARLARWWGPDGFTNTFDTFEFRPGGAWVFTMHGPDGTSYPNQSEFIDIVPGVLMRLAHVNLPHFDLTIALAPTAGGTVVSWVAVFEDRAFAEGARQFLETANEQNLDRLEREVQSATAALPPGLSAIGQIAMTVSDVDRALAFYRDVLGLSFLFQPGPNLAFLDAGGVRLMLSTPQGAGEPGKNSILYFRVQDSARAFASFVERGAAGERPPALAARMPDHELWIGFLRDPDGNLVGLMEERRSRAGTS